MAVHDRLPEILTRLEDLTPADRLVALHALSVAFPALLERPDWKTPVDAIRATLNPTADELGDILISATRIGARLKIDMPE